MEPHCCVPPAARGCGSVSDARGPVSRDAPCCGPAARAQEHSSGPPTHEEEHSPEHRATGSGGRLQPKWGTARCAHSPGRQVKPCALSTLGLRPEPQVLAPHSAHLLSSPPPCTGQAHLTPRPAPLCRVRATAPAPDWRGRAPGACARCHPSSASPGGEAKCRPPGCPASHCALRLC